MMVINDINSGFCTFCPLFYKMCVNGNVQVVFVIISYLFYFMVIIRTVTFKKLFLSDRFYHFGYKYPEVTCDILKPILQTSHKLVYFTRFCQKQIFCEADLFPEIIFILMIPINKTKYMYKCTYFATKILKKIQNTPNDCSCNVILRPM